MVKNKALKDLDVLGDLDGVASDEDGVADTSGAAAVQVKYVCMDRGEFTAPPLRRVGGGYMLVNTRFVKLPAGKSAVVHTGIQLAIPKGYQGRVTILNRLAKEMITVGGGIVDANHVDELLVVLINHSNQDRTVREGNNFAVLTLERLPDIELVQVPSLKTTFAQASKAGHMADLDGFRAGGGVQSLLGGLVSRRDK